MEKTDFLSEAMALEEYMVYCRRSLHAIAESGFETHQTLRFVAGELELMGIRAEKCGKAGLTALLGQGEGECFLLRADMDALPMTEKTGLDFASGKGGFHGCGHDAHTAMLLGAAKLLKKQEGKLRCPVKLMFQSAEETLEGAKDMIEAGVLRSPKVGGAMMLHVMTGVSLPVGSIIVPEPGIGAPAADYFRIEVMGRGCHGSSPNLGVDPISAAAHMIIAMQELSARELAMKEAAVLTLGSIHGGKADNVIPDTVTMGGTLRAVEEETREYIKKRLSELTEGIARSFRAEAKLSFGSGCPGLLGDEKLLGFVRDCAVPVLGEDRVFSAADFSATGGRRAQTAGSEDFAYISREVPSVMLALAAGEPEKGFVYPLHHPKADFDEAALPYGTAVLAECALRWGDMNRDNC